MSLIAHSYWGISRETLSQVEGNNKIQLYWSLRGCNLSRRNWPVLTNQRIFHMISAGHNNQRSLYRTLAVEKKWEPQCIKTKVKMLLINLLSSSLHTVLHRWNLLITPVTVEKAFKNHEILFVVFHSRKNMANRDNSLHQGKTESW